MNTETKKVNACILIIGNEILSGRTQDKNLAWLAQTLNTHGVQVGESRIIPDVQAVIIDTLNLCRKQFDYVITTGGIGPTHDDITTDCVAKAFGVELQIDPEIAAMIQQRTAPAAVMDSRMRMARIPKGAELVRCELGPPGYKMENVFVLAGIPAVMQAMTKSLVTMLSGGVPVKSCAIDVHLTESAIAGPLGDIQDEYPEISLGSYPFFKDNIYGTSLVMRGTDGDKLSLVFGKVQSMVRALGGTPMESE